MEITECNNLGGEYVHNWCMSKKASVKCCFLPEEEEDDCDNDGQF
jgi:hypothetical protein